MAHRYPPYRPPQTIGAETNQLGVKRGARVATPAAGLSTGAAHDWSAFDSFKASQPGRTPVAMAPQPSAPDAFRTATTTAATRINAGVGQSPSLPRPMAGALRSVAGAVQNAPAPAPMARPAAQPVTPVMQNEIPPHFTDTSGVESSYTPAGGVQERGYNPAMDTAHPANTIVSPFDRTGHDWTRTVAIDPRYGGGVGVGVNGAGGINYAPDAGKQLAPTPPAIVNPQRLAVNRAMGHTTHEQAVQRFNELGRARAAARPLPRIADPFHPTTQSMAVNRQGRFADPAPKQVATPAPVAAPAAPVPPATFRAGEAIGSAPRAAALALGGGVVHTVQGIGNFFSGIGRGLGINEPEPVGPSSIPDPNAQLGRRSVSAGVNGSPQVPHELSQPSPVAPPPTTPATGGSAGIGVDAFGNRLDRKNRKTAGL